MRRNYKYVPIKFYTFIISSLALILIFHQLYSSQIQKTSFHSDEMLWPCMGNIFKYLERGDWNSPQWEMTPFDFTNGPIPRYLYGLGVSLSKNQDYHNFQKICSSTWPSYVGKSMSDLNSKELSFLFYVRKINLVVALIVLWLLFIFLYIQFDIVSALIGTIILGFNDLFGTYAVRSMAEMPLLFFIIASQMVLSLIINKMEGHKTYLKWLVVFGIISGMALMTKPYGIMCTLPTLAIFFSKKIDNTEKIRFIGIVLVVVTLTIILIYPPFLLNPFKIIDWFVEWLVIQDSFQYFYPGVALINPLSRLSAVFQYLIYPGSLSSFSNFLFFNLIALLVFIISISIKYLRTTFLSKDIHLFLIVFGFFSSSTFYLYRTWDRYFLPLLFPFIIIYSYILNSILKFFFHKFKVKYFTHKY